MINLIKTQDDNTSTTAAIARLARAITLSQGQFSLLLVCCNSSNKQQLMSLLNEFLPIAIAQLSLSLCLLLHKPFIPLLAVPLALIIPKH